MSDLKKETAGANASTFDVKKRKFDLADFKLATDRMVATSDSVFSKYGSLSYTSYAYTEENIDYILQYGDPVSKRKLSQHYFYSNGLYQQIVLYYITLLKNSWFVEPRTHNGKSITDGILRKRYFDAVDFLEKVNIPRLALRFSMGVVRDGGYYGLITDETNFNLTIIDLPFNYCRTRFTDFQGNDIVEFNLYYFNSIIDEQDRKILLESYPKDIQEAYQQLENGVLTDSWIRISSKSGICFPGFGNQPLFLSIIPAIYNFEDYNTLEKERDADEVKKLIVQKIPHNSQTDELLFEPEEAEEIHRATVNMMKNNKNFSVLTTYADVDVVGSESVNETVSKNNLEKILAGVYERAGVSPQLFASNGNLALSHSVKKDIALMMVFANNYSNFFTTILNRQFSTGDISFKFTILPISYDNEDEYLDRVMKLVPNGYSLLLPWVAMGFTQGSLKDIKDLENNVLGLGDLLIPPMNSATAASGDAGRPTLAEPKKSAKTLANEKSLDTGGND